MIQEHGHAEHAAFKKLSYQARKKLPKTAYAYTDAQGKGHLPIQDPAHLRNAISRLGQSKTGKKWGLSDEARKRLQAELQNRLGSAQHANDDEDTVAHDVATFDLGPDADNTSLVKNDQNSDVVLRRGMIFRAGQYPDKDFSLTPKELKRVVKDFSDPVQLDSEHERSIFDGKLGQLVSIEANDDGTELHGLVAVPKWLDPILMQAGGKVSAAFDRATKKLVGLALTINPRVSDAALMAAFSVDQAARGGVPVGDLIEMAAKTDAKAAKKVAKADAKAKKKGKTPPPWVKDGDDDDDDDDAPAKHTATPTFVGYDGMVPQGGEAGQSGGAPRRKDAVKMATSSGRSMMQAVHDVTASRGAVCRMEPQPATEVGPYGIVRYASQAEMSTIQAIHDTTLQSGASCVPTLYGQQDVPGGSPWTWQYPGITSEGRSSMPGSTKAPHFVEQDTGSNKAMKAFAKFMGALDGVDPRYTPTQTASVETDTDTRAEREENARLREENRQMRMQGILDRAVSFAEKMVVEGHATPIERDGLITVHAQLEHDDTFSTKATFSNGMSRVAAYEASILARPNNLLAAELLPASVQAGLIKFANMSETPKSTTTEYGKMSPERMRQLTGLDPVLKKAYDVTHSNGHAK